MKKKRNINAQVGEREITLSEGLINSIYEEIIPQIGDEFEEVDLEIKIEVNHEVEAQEEPLSEFNQKLKQALNFDPKSKKG